MQSWDDLAKYPASGVSPLYAETGKELQRILASTDRWTVLPRPVDRVFVRPDQSPCFEMHTGDFYYNHLAENDKAIRWATEQSWRGGFRLLYNSRAHLCRRDEIWLTVDGFSNGLRSLVGGKWQTYQSLTRNARGGAQGFRFAPNSSFFAGAEKGSCWLALPEGLFRLQDGSIHKVETPGWPDSAAGGVISDDKQRVVAWSEATGGLGAKVSFLQEGHWSSTDVFRVGRWTTGAILEDGSAVLAGDRQVVIVAPPSNAANHRELFGSQRQEQLEYQRAGSFSLGVNTWVRPLRVVAVSPYHTVLFSAVKLPAGPQGFVRIQKDGSIDWIDFDSVQGSQIAASPNGGFLICTDGGEIFELVADSSTPRGMTFDEEATRGGRLLGCDMHGRVFFQRGDAIVAFSAEGERTKFAEARDLADFAHTADLNQHHPELRAAVDSLGRAWFIKQNGTAMMLPPQQQAPTAADDRLCDAVALWPGQNGSMLIMRQNGRVALEHNERQFIFAESLLQLVRKSFSQILAAAPRSTGNERRHLVRRSNMPRLASPWLATGNALWITDQEHVYRVSESMASDERKIEIKKVCDGLFEILGPLQESGHLVLARVEPRSPRRMSTWFWIENPEGPAKLRLLASPSAEWNGVHLERPDEFWGDWCLDSKGRLWLHQGFDRVYRICSAAEWQLLRDFGRPVMESPTGLVWAHRGARVFEGYEIVDSTGFRRSCRPTYMNHLTPLTTCGDETVCLTPRGVAALRLDKDDPEKDAVVHNIHVGWRGEPLAHIGVSGERLLIVTLQRPHNTLEFVKLPWLHE